MLAVAVGSNCLKMLDEGAAGRIGPNALTQFLPLIERVGGTELSTRLLAQAGIFELPDMSGLIDERPVARFHHALREELPEFAPALSFAAGERTADYIIANRIPSAARRLLEVLPASLAKPMLVQSITANAWTFAGSGQFRVAGSKPLCFDVQDNPVARGERSNAPICHWNRGVFERLFRRLVAPDYRCEEQRCCACGDPACRFELLRG